MRCLTLGIAATASAGSWAGENSGNGIASLTGPLAVYNVGPNNCDGRALNTFVPGVYDCRSPVPITEASCPAAQWLWTGEPGGYSSITGNEKGNAYCAQGAYSGDVQWGTYPGPHIAVVQEFAGLWLPSNHGCIETIRVCLGTPTQPATTALHGAIVPGCGPTGPTGCAVCRSANVRPGLVPTVDDTCCPAGVCLRHSLAVTMEDAGGQVTSDFAGIDCTIGTCTAEYSELAQVALSRRDEFVDWTGWAGDCSGIQDVCTVTLDADRVVFATYELGGVVSGALSPAGDTAPLPRDDSPIVVARASTVRVDFDGSGYTFGNDGVCACFEVDGASFLCARPTIGSGTVTVTHTASGASRDIEIDFVAARGAANAGGVHGVGACRRISPGP